MIFFVTSVCNAKCRTCFYWEELNQRGDLTWDEIRKLAFSMPQFSDLWLSGGEPMLRRELTDIIHLFHTHNGVRWVNLPTNGLLPERTAEWVARICEENPELQLDLNVALDGLGEMQDSIRAVPGNFAKTLETLEAIQPCRQKYPLLRVNINTVICSENFDQVMAIAEYVKAHCAVDGHYFNIIRGAAKDASLKQIPTHRLAALYKDIQTVYDYYAEQVLRRRTGMARKIAQVYYHGTLALHNKIQLENIAEPHPWPMPCTAGDTSIVIDFNGDVRSCELRGKLANLREYDCDFDQILAGPGTEGRLGRHRPRSVLVHPRLLHPRQPAALAQSAALRHSRDLPGIEIYLALNPGGEVPVRPCPGPSARGEVMCFPRPRGSSAQL